MKTMFAALAVTTALLAISPASARPYDRYAGTTEAQMQIKLQIEHGISNRVISPREADSLFMQLNDLSRRDARYSRNGFTRTERADLTRRSDALRDQVAIAQRTGGRYDRDARMDRRDGAMGDNRGGWDNRVAGNRGDWNASPNDNRVVDNRDNRAVDNRGGWNAGPNDNRAYTGGGVLARDNRGDRFEGDFRVGQRGSADLVALPMEYQSRYPDSQGSYYRYNQGRIYQIDRNSNLIVRMLDPTG